MSVPNLGRALWAKPRGIKIEPVLPFLFPSLQLKQAPGTVPTRPFSASHNHEYPRRDKSKMRGMSAIKSSGLRKRQKLSIGDHPLPKPVQRDHLVEASKFDENHGLWGFFSNEKTFAAQPANDGAHGRAWTVEELRQKSWDDLHSLWWVCVKERNRLSTEREERKRLKLKYGDYEAEEREEVVVKTQRRIKSVLRERHYAWTEARQLILENPNLAKK